MGVNESVEESKLDISRDASALDATAKITTPGAAVDSAPPSGVLRQEKQAPVPDRAEELKIDQRDLKVVEEVKSGE